MFVSTKHWCLYGPNIIVLHAYFWQHHEAGTVGLGLLRLQMVVPVLSSTELFQLLISRDISSILSYSEDHSYGCKQIWSHLRFQVEWFLQLFWYKVLKTPYGVLITNVVFCMFRSTLLNILSYDHKIIAIILF